jgi:hypothetical protein
VVVLVLVLRVHLVGDLDLLFALFFQFLIAEGATGQLLGLTHEFVLPCGRSLVRSVVTITHDARLVGNCTPDTTTSR